MRLSIADALFFPSPIGHAVREMAHAPLLIWGLLQEFNPEVRNEHIQTIVEADAAVLD